VAAAVSELMGGALVGAERAGSGSCRIQVGTSSNL
jgi:hypothetical protein